MFHAVILPSSLKKRQNPFSFKTGSLILNNCYQGNDNNQLQSYDMKSQQKGHSLVSFYVAITYLENKKSPGEWRSYQNIS